MLIRSMAEKDLDFAAACTQAEGWQAEIREDFEVFFEHDPGGCLLAEERGHPVGLIVATGYGTYGFVGDLIVLPEKRGMGVGRQLLEAAVDYLHSRGAKNVLLDGVQAAVSLYERVGFRKVCPSLRAMAQLPGHTQPGVRAMQASDLDEICRLDRAAFGADRCFFLKRRLALHPTLCKVLEQDGRLSGYIMARARPGVVVAGPWVVDPGAREPEKLMQALAAETAGLPIALGFLATNAAATRSVHALGFQERSSPPWRMALGPRGDLGASDLCYAVGSPAKG